MGVGVFKVQGIEVETARSRLPTQKRKTMPRFSSDLITPDVGSDKRAIHNLRTPLVNGGGE